MPRRLVPSRGASRGRLYNPQYLHPRLLTRTGNKGRPSVPMNPRLRGVGGWACEASRRSFCPGAAHGLTGTGTGRYQKETHKPATRFRPMLRTLFAHTRREDVKESFVTQKRNCTRLLFRKRYAAGWHKQQPEGGVGCPYSCVCVNTRCAVAESLTRGRATRRQSLAQHVHHWPCDAPCVRRCRDSRRSGG